MIVISNKIMVLRRIRLWIIRLCIRKLLNSSSRNLVFLVVMIRWGRFRVIFSKIRKGFSIVLKLVNLLLLIYSTTPITPINRIIISIPQLNTPK